MRAWLKWQMIGPEEGRKYDDIGAIALVTSPSIQPAIPTRAQKSRTPLASGRATRNHGHVVFKALIVVANAFERERKLARQAPARIMWTRAELGGLLGATGAM